MSPGSASGGPRQQVGLFVTCLVDLYRPTVGFAAIALIERSGPYTVVVPEAQTCCGQPGYNSGDKQSALAIARQVVAAFEGFDYVVAPSGSCGGMIKTHYPELLAGDPAFAERARKLAGKTYELTQFLRDVARWDGVTAAFAKSVTYHDSCSALRELQVKRQPRELLAQGRRPVVQGAAERRAVLRLRRHLLRQVPRHLQPHGGGQGRQHRGDRRRRRAGGGHGMPAQHRGQAEARGQQSRGAPRRRGAGRHG